MVGLGPTELMIAAMMLFAGSASLPTLGVPLPPDTGMQSAAPPECLLYASYFGMAKPDPKSSNQVEQLLAEPEIQAFMVEIMRLADAGVERIRADDEQERTLKSVLPEIAKTLIARPVTFYVSKVSVPPNQPGVNAALVVHAGEHKAALVGALKALEGLYLKAIPKGGEVKTSTVAGTETHVLPTPPGAPKFAWSIQDEYVFLTIGDDEAESVAQRLAMKTGPPKWLVDLQSQLGIKRLSGVAYLNVADILKVVEPLLPKNSPDVSAAQIKQWIDLLGVRHVTHVSTAAGLDEELAVTKFLIAHDGKADGLLNLAQAKPLTKGDLKNLPAHADFAVATRLDLASLVKQLIPMAEKIDPNAGAQIRGGLNQIEQMLGFFVERDLLASLGDLATVYHSSDDGGLILTGLCASISVRDQARLEGVISKLTRLAEAQGRGQQTPVAVRTTKIGEQTVHYLQILAAPIPVAPAWCIRNDEFVIALSPQMLRAHLTRDAKSPSLADVDAVAKRIATGDVTSLSYSNVEFNLKFGYSYIQYLATAGASALEKETGIQADLTTLPSYAVIHRHLRPAISVSRSTPNGIVTESYSSGAFSDMAVTPAMIGMVAGLTVPAVAKARESARETMSMNNMRQLGIAAMQYESEKGHLPPRAIRSADGKPLLSWRVAILPYIEQQALYEQFHLDEPWDSDHNIRLVNSMPSIFIHPSQEILVPQGRTIYHIPRGEGTLYATDGKLKLSGISMGTSNVALLVESDADAAVEWTKPDDVAISADDPSSGLAVNSRGMITLLFADGAVHKLPAFDNEALLRALFPRKK